MEIVGRLFNHKPVISGEVRLMIDCFDKRTKKDEDILRNFSVNASTLSEKTLPASQKLVSEKLTQIQAKALVCLQMCEQILDEDKNTTCGVETNSVFQNRLEEREIEIQKEKESLELEYEKAVKKLMTEYEEMQQDEEEIPI